MFEYEYTPSGGLSPGLATDMTVVYTPRKNEDVETEIQLLTQTGPIAIPVRCLKKRVSMTFSCCKKYFENEITILFKLLFLGGRFAGGSVMLEHIGRLWFSASG